MMFPPKKIDLFLAFNQKKKKCRKGRNVSEGKSVSSSAETVHPDGRTGLAVLQQTERVSHWKTIRRAAKCLEAYPTTAHSSSPLLLLDYFIP